MVLLVLGHLSCAASLMAPAVPMLASLCLGA